jgi:hypothetical protein
MTWTLWRLSFLCAPNFVGLGPTRPRLDAMKKCGVVMQLAHVRIAKKRWTINYDFG